MSSEIIINATGLAALAMNLRGLAHKSDRKLRRNSAWSSALWALNSLLMGFPGTAAINMVSVGRQASAATVEGRAARVRAGTCAVFLLISFVIGVVTWRGVATACTTAASMLATYAMFYMSGTRLRLALALVASLWIFNGIAYRAWWQLTSSVLSLAMAMYGAWRARERT
jgi:Bacterial inner membrane protein